MGNIVLIQYLKIGYLAICIKHPELLKIALDVLLIFNEIFRKIRKQTSFKKQTKRFVQAE